MYDYVLSIEVVFSYKMSRLCGHVQKSLWLGHLGHI